MRPPLERGITRRLCLSILAAAICAAGAAPAFGQVAVEAPREITGEWTIGEVIGTQPMLLEVSSMAGLLGRKVDIGKTLRLWELFEGTVTSARKQSMLLRDMIALPIGASPREIDEANHRFDIFEVGTTDCRYHGKSADACPVFVIGHDLDTDQVGLITFPFGFAAFERRP